MKHPLTELRWQQILHNSNNTNFYYGVKTTKIFCKPACVSRQPRKENVVIFKTTSEALMAGFRPCKRCQPTGELSNKEWIEQVKIYLKMNYQKKLTLDQIAEDCHGSNSNLQRTFSKIQGCSPNQYLTQIRLSKAQELLKSTDLTSKTIAVRCGFNSDTYFNTVFKKHFNMTPLEYKES